MIEQSGRMSLRRLKLAIKGGSVLGKEEEEEEVEEEEERLYMCICWCVS